MLGRCERGQFRTWSLKIEGLIPGEACFIHRAAVLDFRRKSVRSYSFVLAAVSPAVVVPAMIDLTNKKLGTDKGIPTLLMAASSFDDVAAITGFGVVLGMIFSGGASLAMTLAAGPLEAVAGLLIGAILGVVLALIFKANRLGIEQVGELLFLQNGFAFVFHSLR